MNRLNLRLAEGIRRVGFRKWYERELLSSHAHMLLAFLCVIALMPASSRYYGGRRLQMSTDSDVFLVGEFVMDDCFVR